MKRMSLCFVVLFLAIGLTQPTPAFAQETEDVIILCDGDAEALVAQIEALGGRINIQYKNVNALAATVPSNQLAALRSLANVASVEKDALVALPGDRDAAGRATSYLVEDDVQVESLNVREIGADALPQGYVNFLMTGAFLAWAETNFGDGSIVAVVDTGTVPNACLGHAVIGAPGFPDGYNATGDGFPATDFGNHWHGTHVGGVIASDCALDFTGSETHPVYLAVSAILGWPVDFVPILGQAPGAQLYPVKVFRQDGAGSPNSIILDGLDHILTLKKDGLLDVDIVNMSLGGPTLFDGRDAYDRFVEEFAKWNILVVTSAGNEGPIPNSVGSPATSFGTLAVGATDEPLSSRTFYEYLGWAVFGAPGQGMVMRPTDESRIVNYSARGPLTDGRIGPDMSALGHWNFQAGTTPGSLRWAGGTSFSAPTVSGAAALLNAWWEGKVGKDTYPGKIRNSLMMGANPEWVGEPWRDDNAQGTGVVDVPASLKLIKDKHTPNWWPIRRGDHLEPNLFLDSNPKQCDKKDSFKSEVITLQAGETEDFVIAIDRYTDKVTLEVENIVTPDNSAYAYWGNALQVNVQSAKRTAIESVIGWLWYPYWFGDAFTLEINDGPWTSTDMTGSYLEANLPMERGLMKMTFSGDYSNEAPVSFTVKVRRENRCERQVKPLVTGKIDNGDEILIGPFKIGSGYSLATIDLAWKKDWSRFPTHDLDFLVFDEAFNVVGSAGTLNAPERATIIDPEGIYYVLVIGYELFSTDEFGLFVTVE